MFRFQILATALCLSGGCVAGAEGASNRTGPGGPTAGDATGADATSTDAPASDTEAAADTSTNDTTVAGSGSDIADTGTAGTPSGSGGAPSAGAPGGMVTPPEPAYCESQTLAPLPVDVFDAFAPWGYWNTDSDADVLVAQGMQECMVLAEGDTGTDPAPDRCYSFFYDTSMLPETPLGWVGFQFNFGTDGQNWTGPGLCIDESASRITFWARSDVEGAVWDFGAAAAVSRSLTLTTTWTQYELTLGQGFNSSADNGGVTQAFYVTSAQETGGDSTLFLGDVMWE